MPLRRLALMLSLVATLAFAPGFNGAWAQGTVSRIVAAVNDDAITDFDLNARAMLLSLSSNVPLNAESRPRIARAALRELIDDRLKVQEAERLGVTVSDQEVGAAIERIERSNNLQPGGLMNELTRGGVPVITMIDQVKANLLWRKVLRRRVLPQVRVATDEVDDALERIREAGGGAIIRAAEIFLPTTSEEERRQALGLASQIRAQAKSAAQFANLASEYSRAPTAAVGGDLGEVQPGQLAPELDSALNLLSPGETSPPIETARGVYLVHMISRRQVEAGAPEQAVVSLARAVLPIEDGETVETAKRKLTEAIAGVDGCDVFERAAQTVNPNQPARVVDARIGDLPPELVPLVAPLKPGQTTPAIQLGGGVAVVMLCRRAEVADSLPSAVQVAEAIQNQRAQRRAERYLRDLRRVAFIDIRG